MEDTLQYKELNPMIFRSSFAPGFGVGDLRILPLPEAAGGDSEQDQEAAYDVVAKVQSSVDAVRGRDDLSGGI